MDAVSEKQCEKINWEFSQLAKKKIQLQIKDALEKRGDIKKTFAPTYIIIKLLKTSNTHTHTQNLKVATEK